MPSHRSLADLAAQVPSTNPDRVLDSGSEGEDEDNQPRAIATTLNTRILNEVRGNGVGSPFGASRPSARSTPAATRVSANVGRGGRLEYKVEKANAEVKYYSVQWRKPQTKKHKTWDGDAYLKVEGSRIYMFGDEGKPMATSVLVGGLVPGAELRISSWECEVDQEMTEAAFNSATSVLNKVAIHSMAAAPYVPSTYAKPFKTPTVTHPARKSAGYIPPKVTPAAAELDNDDDPIPIAGPSRSTSIGSTKGYKTVQSDNFYGAKQSGEKIVIGEKSNKMRKDWGGALHDPKAEDAVVMRRPPKEYLRKTGQSQAIDVVLDPLLSAKMRDHQKAGVKFMYDCVMGFNSQATGCILADEMGLGKTLQTIALIHTLLKQSPYEGQVGVIGKALIVCPVSLVQNWKKEFRKWVRPTDISVVAADGMDSQITAFQHHRAQHVLIIGYERLRKVIKHLAACQPPIDLIVCDEGHRLKSKDNKTTRMFDALRTRRRIILSGTPLQNDLGEYYSMSDFACPGLLGSRQGFTREYEKPIVKSRSVGCSEEALAQGQKKATELATLSTQYVLRRTANVLKNYLPPKHEYVVFVAPTKVQLRCFAKILSPSILAEFTRGRDTTPLGFIDVMRKICNTPTMLRLKKEEEGYRGAEDEVLNATSMALAEVPSDMNTYDPAASGKLLCLDRMLHQFYTKCSTEKVVVVSNWTSTLNVIQEVCKTRKYQYLRLDGSTPQKQRQELVDAFNREGKERSFVFLLSAKAGGVGLNLIGASRLILFDSDWNPSTDLQAMARIHRDGQKRNVFMYRLLTTNTIDEKIYQRQITKTGLSDQMLDHKQTNKGGAKDSFTAAELRDIFRLNIRTNGCQTHDLLACDCKGEAQAQRHEHEKMAAIEAQEAAEAEEKEGKSPPAQPMSTESDDEDEGPRFVNAASYNPEPTGKMKKKMESEQKEKLAALKKWVHYNAMDRKSFDELKDDVLYQIAWEGWDEADGISAHERASAMKKAKITVTEDVGDGDADDTMKGLEDVEGLFDVGDSLGEKDTGTGNTITSSDLAATNTSVDNVDASDDDDVPIVVGKGKKRKMRLTVFSPGPSPSPSVKSIGEDGEDRDEDEDEPKTTPPVSSDQSRSSTSTSSLGKRTRGTRAAGKVLEKPKNKGKGKDKLLQDENGGMMYNLKEIAERGGGGRIMYVFEKISASEMLKDKKGKIVED